MVSRWARRARTRRSWQAKFASIEEAQAHSRTTLLAYRRPCMAPRQALLNGGGGNVLEDLIIEKETRIESSDLLADATNGRDDPGPYAHGPDPDSASTLVVCNVPKVGREKYNKLLGVLGKLTDKHGGNERLLPVDDQTGHTLGVAIVIYKTKFMAARAMETLDGWRLDKSHTFYVMKLDDLENMSGILKTQTFLASSVRGPESEIPDNEAFPVDTSIVLEDSPPRVKETSSWLNPDAIEFISRGKVFWDLLVQCAKKEFEGVDTSTPLHRDGLLEEVRPAETSPELPILPVVATAVDYGKYNPAASTVPSPAPPLPGSLEAEKSNEGTSPFASAIDDGSINPPAFSGPASAPASPQVCEWCGRTPEYTEFAPGDPICLGCKDEVAAYERAVEEKHAQEREERRLLVQRVLEERPHEKTPTELCARILLELTPADRENLDVKPIDEWGADFVVYTAVNGARYRVECRSPPRQVNLQTGAVRDVYRDFLSRPPDWRPGSWESLIAPKVWTYEAGFRAADVPNFGSMKELSDSRIKTPYPEAVNCALETLRRAELRATIPESQRM